MPYFLFGGLIMPQNREIHNIRRRADRAFAREIREREKAGASEKEIAALKKGYANLREKTMAKYVGKGPGAAERQTQAFAKLYAFTSNIYQVRNKQDIARSNLLFSMKMKHGMITGNKKLDSIITSGFWAATRKYWMGSTGDRMAAVLAGMQKSNPQIQTYQDAYNLVMREIQNNSQFDALRPYLSGLDESVEAWDMISGLDVPEEIISDFIKRSVVTFR